MDDFFWIGGELWLDAVNSEWISNGQRVDGWRDMASLQAWLREASRHHDEAEALNDVNLDEGEALLHAVKQLRAVLRVGCETAHAARALPKDSLTLLNRALSGRGVVSRLEEITEGWREREILEDTSAGVLWLLARSAARSWVRSDLRRLKPCANPECILWFMDTSKNGTRRWCSMQACGNRHKVTAHYKRRKRDGDEEE